MDLEVRLSAINLSTKYNMVAITHNRLLIYLHLAHKPQGTHNISLQTEDIIHYDDRRRKSAAEKHEMAKWHFLVLKQCGIRLTHTITEC